MADICVRSSAPIIPMAKTKAGRMIFVTLVLQKGIWGLPNFVGKSEAEAGNAVSNFRSSWHNSLSPCPQRCSTPQCKHMWWCEFFYFFCQFYNYHSELSPHLFILHLFESWVSIWVLFLQSLLISWTGWLREESRFRENEWWSQEHTEMCLILWTMLFPLGLPVSLIIPLLTSGVNN